MVIEINKDIDRYQESMVMGLTAKQLIYSLASVLAGGGIVLLLYRYIGLTPSVYVAIPVVAPIALGGFYSFNGMSFYEVMRRKITMLFANRPLTYVSAEGEAVIKACMAEETVKNAGRKKDSTIKKEEKGNREEFERMKQKTRKMLLGVAVTVAVAVIGAVIYKVKH